MKKGDGFILPTVLIICIALMAVGLSLIQSTSSISHSIASAYTNRLGTEAADSGIVYANYCIAKYGAQTWDAAGGKPLTQSTDCYGNVVNTYPKSLQTSNNLSSTFLVSDNDVNQIEKSTGTVNTTFTSGGTTTILSHLSITEKQTSTKVALHASFSTAGTAKTCGIVSGSAYCWGLNSSPYTGQLGDGTTTDSYTPVEVLQETGVLGGKTPTKLAAGEYHVCALASNSVYCWGTNDYGQLGNGTTNGTNKPVAVGGALASQTVTDIGVADRTTCAIASGQIYCWGDNSFGTDGTGSTTSYYTLPQLLTAGLPANYVATGLASDDADSQTMCAIVNTQAYCWGDDRSGTIGNGTTSSNGVTLPTAVSTSGALAGKTITHISVEGYDRYSSPTIGSHACAIASDNQLYCWGDNDYGQLGIGSTTEANTPTLVSAFAGQTVQGVATGTMHTCVLLSGNTVECMGANMYGQQGGNGAMTSSNNNLSPTPIADPQGLLTGKSITSISGGANRSCIIADFSTYCWGYNSVGQIGDGTTTNRNTPTLAKFLQPTATGYLF